MMLNKIIIFNNFSFHKLLKLLLIKLIKNYQTILKPLGIVEILCCLINMFPKMILNLKLRFERKEINRNFQLYYL